VRFVTFCCCLTMLLVAIMKTKYEALFRWTRPIVLRRVCMLSTLNSIFAVSDIHISLKPETVFEVGGIAISNSMIFGVLISIFIGWFLVRLNQKATVKAKKGSVAIIEIIIEFLISVLESAFGDRKKAIKYAPIFGTFFLFILFNNTLGMLPIVGPGLNVNGTPLLRPFTADLNGTLAMSIIAIIGVQIMSIQAQGIKGHFTHYFSDKPLNPLNFFIGILEVFGELTRVMSLSLRLFLNTAVGEILIIVFTSLVLSGGRTPIVAIPIFLFEALVAGIQAYVFTVLAATYLAIAISHSHEELPEHDVIALKKVERAVVL
jgi:F-type H+-transporting ATPase subunit a